MVEHERLGTVVLHALPEQCVWRCILLSALEHSMDHRQPAAHSSSAHSNCPLIATGAALCGWTTRLPKRSWAAQWMRAAGSMPCRLGPPGGVGRETPEPSLPPRRVTPPPSSHTRSVHQWGCGLWVWNASTSSRPLETTACFFCGLMDATPGGCVRRGVEGVATPAHLPRAVEMAAGTGTPRLHPKP